MKYKQVTVSTTHEFSDFVSVFLCECGSEGVSVYDCVEFREALDKFNWDYADETLFKSNSEVVLVSGFFSEDFDTGVISDGLIDLTRNASENAGSLEMSCTVIDSEDWENVWMQFYKPMLMKNVAIVPKWLKNPFENVPTVFINPGMAFGTGSHETTAMCVELMQIEGIEGMNVADVGCGSGILGLCSLALGAKKCTFVDIDPNAVKATRDNAEFNGLMDRCEIIEGSLLAGKGDKFDLILANLTADILLLLYPQLEIGLKSGGEAIVSGIIADRLDEVIKAYLHGFEILQTLERGDWRALRLRHKDVILNCH